MAYRRMVPFADDELGTQIRFLDYLRQSVAGKVEGLDEVEVRRRLVDSETNLLGLIQHLIMAECYWFDLVWSGSDVDLPTGSMIVADDRPTADVVADYRERTARSNQTIAGADPDASARGETHRGESVTLRWILTHMVEETARHAGHADILREQVDGATGR